MEKRKADNGQPGPGSGVVTSGQGDKNAFDEIYPTTPSSCKVKGGKQKNPTGSPLGNSKDLEESDSKVDQKVIEKLLEEQQEARDSPSTHLTMELLAKELGLGLMGFPVEPWVKMVAAVCLNNAQKPDVWEDLFHSDLKDLATHYRTVAANMGGNVVSKIPPPVEMARRMKPLLYPERDATKNHQLLEATCAMIHKCYDAMGCKGGKSGNASGPSSSSTTSVVDSNFGIVQLPQIIKDGYAKQLVNCGKFWVKPLQLPEDDEITANSQSDPMELANEHENDEDLARQRYKEMYEKATATSRKVVLLRKAKKEEEDALKQHYESARKSENELVRIDVELKWMEKLEKAEGIAESITNLMMDRLSYVGKQDLFLNLLEQCALVKEGALTLFQEFLES